MKKIIIACFLLICSSIQLFAQTNYDTERGIELYNNERYTEAITSFQRAAKSGDVTAQTWLGIMYQQGKGVAKSTQIAMNMYNKAIAKNYAPAMIQLGNMYTEGDGVNKSPAKAFEIYKKAADLKSGEGLYIVGLCYENGIGVAKDSIKAFNYYYSASEAGNKRGHGQLAYCYYLGKGTERNLENAVKHFEAADNARSDFATYWLANMYYQGEGTTADPIKAEELLAGIMERETNAAELYPTVKKAADAARYRIKMEKLYEDSWSGCKRYTFDSNGNSNDTPGGKGKSFIFNNNSLTLDNYFYHNDIFSITFWIKGKNISGSILRTVKSNAPNPDVFPSIEIKNDQLTFIPGPYADVKAPFSYPLSSLQDGKWHYIAVTFGHKLKKLYVDGKLVGNMNANTAQISQGNVIYLGGGKMQLANVRLYKANILSHEEIKSIYMMEAEGK